MRKSLILCFILFPFLFSCLNLLGLEEKEEKEEKGSIKVILEDSNDIDSFTVTILNESEDLIAQRVSNPGTNVLFEDLEEGNYIVNILAYDINNNLIKTGSKTVEVKVDEVVNADVLLEYVIVQVEKGSIEINIEDNSSVSKFIITILNHVNELIDTKIVNSAGKVLFNELEPGNYKINIDGLDSNNVTVITGIKELTVKSSEVVQATIPMTSLTGSVEIIITLPE